MRYYIGTSGWHYNHWREKFYPKRLAKSRWLEFYSEKFSTVELNNSFYRLPSERAFTNWRDSSPIEFIFSVKVSRYITHIKRLKNTAEPISNFMARARLLDDKLGPLLYQLPKNMKRDSLMLEEFLKTLPENSCNVVEFRHNSWFDAEIFEILRHYNAGFCIYDMPDFTTPVIATSNFAYVRFHGSRQLYGSCYSEKELEDWAIKFKKLGVSNLYAYFNNDAEGFATKNALMFRHLLELPLSND
ncbi:DUF72 domain-containing protein [Chloroflexota bacterium]